MEPVQQWSEVGERVRQARLAAGLTQADLASKIDLERSALARAEGGSRRLDALELFRLSDVLGLPLAHFVTRPPAAVVSRRTALVDESDRTAQERYLVDTDLETHLRETRWLVDHELLVPPQLPAPTPAETTHDARSLAQDIRRVLGLAPTQPLDSPTAACETFGLYLLVVDRDADGASLLSDRFGVAVVGGRPAPGRRRFTAVHELGHHLLGDAYHSDVGVAASLDDREQIVHAFAAELLLPESAILAGWERSGPVRTRLIWIAGTYRVSWSVAVSTARRLGLINAEESQSVRADTPRRGDFIATLGSEPAADLPVGEVGPAWRQAVLAGWTAGLLTATRTAELLRSMIDADELPERNIEPTP